MTLKELLKKGSKFCFNEVTGELIEFCSKSGDHRIMLPGDNVSPDTICTMIFDEEAVLCGWAEMQPYEANLRIITAYRKSLPIQKL